MTEGKPTGKRVINCQIQFNLFFMSRVFFVCVCGFIKQININKFCREKHHFFFLFSGQKKVSIQEKHMGAVQIFSFLHNKVILSA